MPNLKRNYLRTPKLRIAKELLIGHEANTTNIRRKRLPLSSVSAKTRVEIVRMALMKERTHKEIGELFNVSTSVVSQLSSVRKRAN